MTKTYTRIIFQNSKLILCQQYVKNSCCCRWDNRYVRSISVRSTFMNITLKNKLLHLKKIFVIEFNNKAADNVTLMSKYLYASTIIN